MPDAPQGRRLAGKGKECPGGLTWPPGRLSLRDLRLLRNTIYARRGRTFKSLVIRDHFKGMDWYKPRADYDDKLLSRNDVRNIGLIKTVENELGGPLTDEDWLTEPVSDGA